MFSSFLYNLEKKNFGRIIFMWKSIEIMVCFHPEYFDFKRFLRHRKKSKEMPLQEVKGKILLSLKKPTGFCDTNLLSFDSISCKPHSGERKSPPANKQKKIKLIIIFDLMEQSGFQCCGAQTSFLTHHLAHGLCK